MTKTLCILTADEYAPFRGQLMGFTVLKDSKHVKVYDNWVNRIVLGVELPDSRVSLSTEQLSSVTAQAQAVYDNQRLKEFQRSDIVKMQRRHYALNRNKMGAGKTVEFIALCKSLDAGSILVCCPKPVIAQWVAQFKAWWPERSDDVYAFTSKSILKIGDIVVTNYEKLSSKKYSNRFKNFTWSMVGVDEAHMIKNRTAQRTIAVKSIPSVYHNAMTGTPVLRNPDDLYSILQFLNPEIVGGSYWNFVEYFCEIKEDFFGRHIAGLTHDEQHVEVLKRILAEVSVYNEIEVAQGKRHIVIPLEMHPYQRKLYNNIRKILLDELPNTVTIPNGAVMVTRLLQTTSCPSVFNTSEVTYNEGVKFEWLLGMLESDPTMKVVVFSKFAKVVNCLKKFLTEKGVVCVSYTGQQSQHENEARKEDFINLPYVRVIAGTIDAMGTGIDGLQKVCNVCVFVDRDYRPSINSQAEDRLHRTGQGKEVLCYYLECDKTVDKHVAKLNTTRIEDIRKLLEEKA